MKTIYSIIFVAMLNFVFLAGLSAHDDIHFISTQGKIVQAEKKWEDIKGEELNLWEQHKSNLDKSWNKVQEREQREWRELEEKVKSKWLDFVASTKRIWVEYSEKVDTRSRVDFKEGKIIIETAVQAKRPGAEQEARNNIELQLKKIFSKENITKKKILKKQVANKHGEVIKDQNIDDFIQDEVLPSVQAEKKTYMARDDIIRKKYKATINMVPDHIRVRASKYVSLVKDNARRYQLPPQLIMAIIHTESYFNPLAVSSCGAIGLMQVIPEQAGREAYSFLFGKDTIVSQEYLYQSHANIKLGTAYLYLLKNQHFSDIGDSVKNRYVSICGYNWGPTAVRNKILKYHFINKLSRSGVYELLSTKTPRETRQYLQKVTKRMPLYDPFFI